MVRPLPFWFALCLVGLSCSSGSAPRSDASPGADRALVSEDVASTDVQVAGSGGSEGSAGVGGAPGAGGTIGVVGAGGVIGMGGQPGVGGTNVGGTGGWPGTGGSSGGSGGGAGQSGFGGIGTAVDAAAGGITGSGGQPLGSGGALGPGDALIEVRGEDPFPTCGTIKATLGGNATYESSTQRYAVSGSDCRKYIVQNNNFANPTGSVQTVSCTGTSFTVVASTCAATSTEPAAFPSVYIGGNGNIANGAYLTWDDSGLPKQISAIMRAQTSFNWKGGSEGGDFAATIDAWFAKGKPTAGAYDDAISGSLMIWLSLPVRRQPVGKWVRQATVAGRIFDVWVGPHGATALGTDQPQRPVVSYVVKDASLSGLDFDLANFITDAVAHGSADMSEGGTSAALASSWYLTDVFAGFQIWTGSDATGLTCSKFSCRVQ